MEHKRYDKLIVLHDGASMSGTCTRLREVAGIIDAEVARIQTAQVRWQSRQAPKA